MILLAVTVIVAGLSVVMYKQLNPKPELPYIRFWDD